ncbi:MAG: glutamine synthetase family protein, partial [Actinomycetota bacterium]|nr:glutamine synthetase family protein [Actinomycetota bacterium]
MQHPAAEGTRPANKQEVEVSVDEVVARARDDDVRLVRFLYCDPSGVIRGKNVHIDRLAARMREGIGLTRAQNAINMLEDFVAIEGLEPVGEIRLVPDPNSYTNLPWVPRTASLLCDQLDHDWTDWGCCPRSFLKRVISDAEQAGVRVKASFENEFYLAQEVNGVVGPYGNGPVYSSAGMDRVAYVMDDIVSALEIQEMGVEQAINEYGPGQQEIAIRYADALRAADNQLKFRDTVRGVAEVQHELIASFAAKPFADGIGSGAHIHFSLWSADGSQNLLYDAEAGDRLLSETGRRFVAGVLDHLPALVALTCPSFNSYERLRPGAWAGSTVSWGLDNRECSVRVASPFRGREMESTNIELKACDPSCNPYLALGGLILAGLDGVRRELQPPEAARKDPARMSAEERARCGINPLPASLAEALANLQADRVLYPALG